MVHGKDYGENESVGNAADKQKRYRQKKKAEETAMQLALAVYEDVKASEVALFQVLYEGLSKARSGEIFLSDGTSYTFAYLYIGKHFSGRIDLILFKHLVRKGALVLSRKKREGSYYDFCLEKMEREV